MKARRCGIRGLGLIACCFCGPLGAQNTLDLGQGAGETGDVARVSLRLTTSDEVQGIVAVFQWDGARGTGADLVPAAALAEADTVVTRVENDFMVLGVVMDSNPADNGGIAEVVGPGQNILLATALITCSGADPLPTPVTFVDDTFAAAEGGPALDNVVVVGGLSIGNLEGLNLDDGEFTCAEQLDKLIIESGDNSSRAAANEGLVRILMNNTQEVEGFVTSVCNDPGVTVTDVVLGADAAEADFTASEIDPATGAAFGVVIDLFDPMQFPPNIPQGRGHHVASYIYACDVVPAAGQPEIVVNLEFCDGRIGDPLKENLIVSGGRSKTAVDGLVLENGTFTCRQVGPPPREDCTNGIDDDGDGLVDGDDPDCQAFDFEVVDPVTLEPTILQVIAGTTTRGLLALNAPTAESLGVNGSSLGGDLGPEVHVTVQGFSLGFEFDCDEIQVVESFDVSGTVLESLNAEFLQVQADNTTDDGDGCSFILAVLIDAAPPFDGAALPALPGTQPLGLLAFDVREGLACNDELLIVPRDGVTARGNVPVRNVISVDGQAFRTSARPIGIRIVERGRFFRGDCNFSFRQGGLEPINIADAAAVLSFLFQLSSLKFDPPCLDACDANDDGRLDLADAAAVLRFLFTPGAPFPPSPGPGFDRDLVPSDPGPDLSPDLLDCKAGEVCQTP